MKENVVKDFENLYLTRPHAVIIGAGATIDSIPNGDKYGKKSAVMNGFIKKLKLESLFEKVKIHTNSDNLEDIYSELDKRGKECADIKKKLEDTIWQYFHEMKLPDEPTKYDLLVLSLTRKDCIASFNWDPLLLEAYNRAKKITDNRPELLFLHGNVLAGYCEHCKRNGPTVRNCDGCNKPFTPSPLLYPVSKKSYEDNIFIKDQWHQFENYLSRAALLTIYGYSAPKTDKAAIRVLKQAFTKIKGVHTFDYIEIIDKVGCNHDEIAEKWKSFFKQVNYHYDILDSIFSSMIAKYPRRSVEFYYHSNLNRNWNAGSSINFEDGLTFENLKEMLNPYIIDENKNGKLNLI